MAIKIVSDLLPKGASNRPGTKMVPTSITIHNTGNSARGADADAHSNDIHGGAKARGVSWHYTVDDSKVLNHIPPTERAYHAKSGNAGSIGIEICMNKDIDFGKACRNAIALCQYLMDKYGITSSKVVQHNYWTGKNCPQMLREGFQGWDWARFKKELNGNFGPIVPDNENVTPGGAGGFKMPTAKDYKGAETFGYQPNLRTRLAGTDQWNDVILEECTKKGINPIFLKCIMATESMGNIKARNGNVIGIMQIKTSWGYDVHRLQTDVNYAVSKACDIFKTKAKENQNRPRAQGTGGPDSIYNVAHGYIGWGKDPLGGDKSGTYYAQIAGMYEGFGLNRTDSISTQPSGNFSGGTGDTYTPAQYEAIYEGRKIYGDGGWYDGEAFEGISGIYEKPDFVPPHYYDDDFKQLKHRYQQGEYFMRIGDTRFVVPPTQIRVSESSNITKFSSLRQKQSMKVSTGSSMKSIEMTLMFTDFDQINGYEMDGPDRKTYYMDGLRALIAQMKVMPFLPVENEFLNFVHNVYAVAIHSANIGVVEGFPGMMKVDLTLVEFDAGVYLNKPSWLYDQHFIWPLFRMHYQSLLNGDTITGDTLMPFVGDDVLDFWHLDEKALERYEDEVKEDNDKKVVKKGEAKEEWEVDSETRQKTWWDYNEKLDNAKDTNLLFQQFKIPPNYQIIDINATFGNTLTPLTPSLTGKPTFQYFGSQDTRFNIIIQTQDRDVIKAFNDLKAMVDRLAREYRDGFVSSMLRLNNNFVNMLGVKGVLIESLSSSTIQGSPDDFYIAMTLLSFDETQHGEEKLGHLDTLDLASITSGKDLAKLMAGKDIAAFDNNITQAVAAETALNELELYPDLELPTYVEVTAMLSQINKSRKDSKLDQLEIKKLVGPIGAKYVDPDFYFSYPTMELMIKKLEEQLNEPLVKDLVLDVAPNLKSFYGEKAPSVDAKDYFGDKAVAQIERTSQDGDNLKEAYTELGYSDLKGIGARWDVLRESIVDPAKYTKRFWMKAWSGESGHWDTKKTDVEDTLQDDEYKVGFYAKQQAKASVKELSESDFFSGMLHDMMKYDRRGTMMRAFPTYVFVIVDEGRYVNVRKLWDNYYTYHSISEINVHMSRSNPIHTAHIKLSNVYGALNNAGKYHFKPKTPGWRDMVDTFVDSFFSNVTDKELLERAIIYKSIQLMAGARIHIRMGYGACASQLPPVFNGIITEIDTGDMVSIVAQSFGYELTNEIGAEPGETTSMFEEGLEPTELFRYYMTERQSNYTFAWRDSAEPENYQSAHGIEHFGFLRVRDDQNPTDIFNSWYWDKEEEINAEDYDIMKNVYSSTSYNKIGTDEDAPSDHADAGVDFSDISEDDSFEVQREKALKAWHQDEIVTIKAWKDYKTDFKGIAVSDERFFKDGILDTIESKDDAEEVVEEMLVKGTGDAGRQTLMQHLYWWAASPKTKSRLSGNNYKWLSEDGKPDLYKKDFQDLLEPIKDKYPALYKTGVATLNAIANEWARVSFALESYLISTRDKGAGGNIVDDFLDGENKDETNVRMQLEGKAPWDVFRMIERVTPEYVVYPHIHQFGYTLFFGKPWWDVQCGYVLPPTKDKKPEKYGQKISDYVELSKPFSQLHLYTSYGDIIHNGIKAVGTNLATAVIPVFELGKEDEAYEVIWADYYIRGSFQRTKTVDTSLVQNIPYMPNWMERLGTGVLNFFDGASKYQNHAVRFAQGVMAESFKDMYEGEITVIGDPSAKPYDMMYIDDFYTKMNGSADMGEVTQMMSVETGFITSINPDLSVIMNPDPTSDSDTWADDNSLASENFFRQSHVVYEFGLQAWRIYSLYKIGQFFTTTKNLSVLANMARFVKAHQALQKVVMVATISANSGGKMATVAKGVKTVKNSLSLFRVNALRTAAAGVAVPGPGWAATAVSIASVLASTVLLSALDKMFIQKYNNVIKIFPLFYQGRPYVAGINGHKQLIPGWEDNGSGTPIRTSYDNRKQLSPQKASAIYKQTKANDPFNTKEAQADLNTGQNNESGTDSTVISGDPAPFLKQINQDQVKDKMFCYPIMLGSEGASYAGFMKRVTSGFKTSHRPSHQGLDIGRGGPNKANDHILSFADGEVVYAGFFNPDGYGNVILIKHTYEYKNGNPFIFYTVYGHMRLDKIKVLQGDTVKAGQIIAHMGDEGGSQGIHLHFEIMVAKNPVKAAKVKKGMTSINYVFASGGRPNMLLVDPAIYIKEILAGNSQLVKYVKFKK